MAESDAQDTVPGDAPEVTSIEVADEVREPVDEPEGPSVLQTPAEYLAELCGKHQIVLLGDQRYVAQHLTTLAEALPTLHAAGITNLAWEFTNTRSQAQLDDLLAARVWSDRLCADLFIDLLGVGFGYEEYAQVLHAAWRINSELSSDDVPFRIVALGFPTYVEDPDLLDGHSAGELDLRNWWMGGHYRDVSAYHMANVLTAEVIRRGERALVYADAERTTTNIVEWHDGLPTSSLGNLLHRWMGRGVQRVLFHGAVDDPESIERVEQLVAAAPEDAEQFGLDLETSTLGNVGIAQLEACGPGVTTSFRLADIADGYLYVAPRADWVAVELLDRFLAPHTLDDVERRYRALDPREERYSLEELEQIRRDGHGAIEDSWPSLPEPEPEPVAPKRRFGRRRG